MTLLRAAFAVVAALLAPQAAVAQSPAYPAKAVTIIAPIPAGGSTDRLVRQIAQQLQKRLGQPVLVENRPGGSSSIGTAYVAKAAPDGYTLVMVNSSHVINPHVYPALPFDALRDFTPVVQLTSLSMGLFVNPALPVKNLQDFIALVKAKPQTVNYASAGNGGVSHMTGEMFKQATGLAIQHIPYKGSAPAMVDAISGQVEAIVSDTPLASKHVKAGQLRGLAIAAKTRSPALPEVPTFTEAGVRGLENSIWIGLMAPAKTPPEIIRLLNREIVAVMRDPAMMADVAAQGFEVVTGTPEEFGKAIREDYATFGAIVKSANIKAD